MGPAGSAVPHPLAQLILDGVLTGSSYALMATGLVLILGVVKVINLSHGAFFTLGAYTAYILSIRGIDNPVAAVLLASLICFAFGVFLGKSFINPVRSHPFAVAVGSLGFAILFEQAAQMLWGPHPVSVPLSPAWAAGGGIVVRRWGIVSFLLSVALLCALSRFLVTRRGLPLKLIAEEEEIAGSVGIDVEKVRYLTFGAASAAAGAAGALLAPATVILPTMGRVPLILSLIVVIASGMDRVWTTFLLAVALGLAANLTAYRISPGWSYGVLLAGICLLLVLRPSGLAATDGRAD